MSSANLDLVRSIYANWERGDFSSAAWADPEIEFAFADGPEPGGWTGLQEMSGRYGDWLSGWKDFRATPEEYFVLDDSRILVFVLNGGRGRTSGLEFEQRSVANFFEVRGGKVTRLVIYWDRDRAVADLGLAPSANLDLVRSICAEWERGRYTSVEWAHPEIEFVIEDIPASGSWKGLHAGAAAWRDFLEAWEGHQIEVDEYRELDAGCVLTLGAFKARGRASGVDLEQLRTTGASVFYLRDGKVIKLVIYFDRGHALADLGLAPEGGDDAR